MNARQSEPPPQCEQRLSPSDFGRLRSLLDKHDRIVALITANEAKTFLLSTARTWAVFLVALYVVMTSGMREILAKWIK